MHLLEVSLIRSCPPDFAGRPIDLILGQQIAMLGRRNDNLGANIRDVSAFWYACSLKAV